MEKFKQSGILTYIGMLLVLLAFVVVIAQGDTRRRVGEIEARAVMKSAHEQAYATCIEHRRAVYLAGELAWFHSLDRAEYLKPLSKQWKFFRRSAYSNRMKNLDVLSSIHCSI